MKLVLSIFAPIKTVSEVNKREHWSDRHRRVKQQKKHTRVAWLLAARDCNIKSFTPPLMVKLIRHGPHSLDLDNLQSAFKGIRDEVAAILKIDDGRNDLVSYQYDQKPVGKHTYAVTIEVYELRDTQTGAPESRA